MRKSVISLIVSGLACAPGAAPVHAQHATDTTIITIQMGASTKVLDSTNQPASWQALGADETGWNPATPIPDGVRNCLVQKDGAWASAPAFWGADESRPYLFRFVFTVPVAKNYYDSTLTIAAPRYVTEVYLNDRPVSAYDFPATTFAHAVIATHLQPGKNILAVAARGDYSSRMADGTLCSAISAIITIHANGIQAVPPSPKKLRLSWSRVPGAAYYYLQLWLVKATAEQAVTTGSPSSIATQTSGTTYTLSAQSMPTGLYQWRSGAVTRQGALISWSALRSIVLR